MHPWLPSQLDTTKCAVCSRGFIQHLKITVCEACGARAECDIFGNPKDSKSMLLCASCTSKEVSANDLTLSKTKIMIENPPFASLSTSPSLKLIEESQRIDTNIRYNGDVFNAATISFATLKESILKDETIGSLQERHFKYHQVIADRLSHLKQVVFELDNKKHEAVAEQLAARESLREYGNSIREDIRNQIKASDPNYTPNQIIKPPKIKKPVVGTWDRLVESMALTHGISKEEAEQRIRAIRAPQTSEQSKE